MPELPEVETVRRGLVAEATAKRIDRVVITGARTVRRHAAERLVDLVEGRSIHHVRRHGKFLIATLDADDADVLVVHLRMSGQLIWSADVTEPLRPHTHARFMFESGAELRFVDPRTFGELWVTRHDVPELAHLGPDALDGLATPDELASRFERRTSGVKTLLVNQQVVAGIGNIYSDEILFRAGLRQSRTPETLSDDDVVRMHAAMKQILSAAIEAGGSTLGDAQYVDLYGQVGGAQADHQVYGREDQPCMVCDMPIERVKIGGRSSFFCPSCQR